MAGPCADDGYSLSLPQNRRFLLCRDTASCIFPPGAVFAPPKCGCPPCRRNPRPVNPIFPAHFTNTSPTLAFWPPDLAAPIACLYPAASGKAAILPAIAPNNRCVIFTACLPSLIHAAPSSGVWPGLPTAATACHVQHDAPRGIEGFRLADEFAVDAGEAGGVLLLSQHPGLKRLQAGRQAHLLHFVRQNLRKLLIPCKATSAAERS